MPFYVKYPPNGDEHFRRPRVERHYDNPPEWEPCTYGIEPELANTVRIIERFTSAFKETGNPLYAIEVFMQATDAKLYPPLWVLDFFQKRFQHSAKGGHSLDRAFGLTHEGLGKGKRSDPFTSDRLRHRNYLFCLIVFKLEAIGFSRHAACKALASLLARIPKGGFLSLYPDPRYALSPMEISGKGIEKAVRDAETALSAEREAVKEASKHWSEDEQRMMLSALLRSEIPKAVLTRLNM